MGDDDMTTGEIARSLRRLEEGQREFARDMLPTKLYAAEHQAMQQYVNEFVQRTSQTLDRIERQFDEFRKETAGDLKAMHDAIISTPSRWADKAWTRVLAAGGFMVALIGVVIAALTLRKG